MRAKKTKPVRSSTAIKQRRGAASARTKAPPTNTSNAGQRDKDERRTAQRNSIKRPKRPQTAAERHGLTERTDVISETPAGLHTQSTAPNIIDQQFTFWMAMLKMTPWPDVFMQQARMAQLITEFCLPTKSKRS